MLKILYAAANHESSFYSLKRFIDTYGKFFNIKTAAYTKSIKGINVNWNLDALLDFTGQRSHIAFTNNNYALYIREIKRFSPDLIISDMEIYTSWIGIEHKIPVWQVSPMLLHYGIKEKTNFYKYHCGAFASIPLNIQYIKYILNNSDKKLVCSHLGDLSEAPQLLEGYEWLRPNYESRDIKEGSCAIDFADAYYAGKPTLLKTNYNDPESIITSFYNQKYGLSHESRDELRHFNITLDNKIKFLSQYLHSL